MTAVLTFALAYLVVSILGACAWASLACGRGGDRMSKDLWAIAVATAFFLVFAGWNIVDALLASMP